MFTEIRHNGLPLMVSDRIPFRHAFTTRRGGVSIGLLESLNLLSGHGDAPENVRENFRRVTAYLDAGVDDCVVMRQVHGNTVRTVTAQDRHVCLSDIAFDADGIVTAEPNLPLFCFTADCVPVLLADPENRVVGAVHCGWRSSVADILKNAVDAMCALGAKPQSIRAAVGPAIGVCCFETHRDVPDAVRAWLGPEDAAPFIRADSTVRSETAPLGQDPNAKFHVDLRGANVYRLIQLGLLPAHIDVSEECTCCSHEKYWSRRYMKGFYGGQGACIVLPGPEEQA